MLLIAFAAVVLDSAAVQQPAAPNEALRTELAAEVAAYQGQLPLREGPATITAVRLNGLELIYDMRVDQPVDEAAFRRALESGLCGGADTSVTIRRGVTFTYRVTEPAGRTIVASIDRCPSQ